MRSCASLSSPSAHITFCTLIELLRPQIFSIVSLQWPRFFRQHDRDAVADRIGELGGAGYQFLLVRIVFERAFGDRANENLEELRVHAAGGAVGGSRHDRS